MKKKTSTAVEAAKEIVRRNISAKQRAAEYLQLLSPAEVQALQETGELAADAADFSKQSARVSSQAQAQTELQSRMPDVAAWSALYWNELI